MVIYTGMFASVFYDAVPEGGIVPNLIANVPNSIISSLLFVGLCSAIMSTLDSLINTGALSLTVDIYKKYLYPKSTPTHDVIVGRLSTFIIATIALLIALNIRSVLTIAWIGSDFLTTGAFIPLVLGFLWSKGTSTAAIISMLFGLLFSTYNLFAALGFNLPVSWEIASAKQAIVGITISLILYVGVSLLTKDDMEKSKRFVKQANILNR